MDATAPTIPTGTQELSGTVRRIIWSNWKELGSSNGTGRSDDTAVVIAAVLRKDEGSEAVVRGPCPEDGIVVGGSYRFMGKITSSPKYGEQFSFSTFTVQVPATRRGVISYLTKLCPNVGEIRAAALYDTFGPDACRYIREQPEYVASHGLLSLSQAHEAADAMAKHADLEETKLSLFAIFERRGFPNKIIDQCIARWGAASAQRVQRNPFGLMTARPRLPGAGFKRCDKLYLDLGKPPHALKRQMLCGWNAVREDGTGHTWLHFGNVREAITRAVGGDQAQPQKAVTMGIRSGWLGKHTDASGDQWIAEAKKAENERKLAARIRILSQARCHWADATADLAAGLLSDHQRETAGIALASPVGILSGTPGTGKTFTAAQIVKWLACRVGLDHIAFCAPTGKAAVRATAAMKHYALDLTATTVHRLLEVGRNGHDGDGWGFDRNDLNPLPHRYVLVDEASMLDTDLAAALFAACQPGTHVLLIGDPYQLPPVGHGAPLRDMIAAGVPCGELTEIRRNAGQIVHACAAIKVGKDFETADKFVPEEGKNLRHLEAETADEAIDMLRALHRTFREKGTFHPINDLQVLVAVNGKSRVSRLALNKLLQQELNADGQTVAPNPFRVGDKIICTKNTIFPLVEPVLGRPAGDVENSYRALLVDAFIANGDMGKVLAVAPKSLIAKFPLPDRIIKIPLGRVKQADGVDDREQNGEMGTDDGADAAAEEERSGTGCDFALAYAITTHKSQGSEWPCVVVMIDDTPGAKRVCCREHVYTAISRGKSLVVTIGKKGVLLGQCRKVSLAKRKTFLKELLQVEGKPS